MSSATLQVAVQPPAIAQVGAVLEPPIALTMSTTSMSNGHGHGGCFGSAWASAALVTESGSVVNGSLSGSLSDSVHSFANQDDMSGYFLFDNLAIESTGNFRIRVTLFCITGDGATNVGQVETELIAVEDAEVEQQLPSYIEQLFLEALPNFY